MDIEIIKQCDILNRMYDNDIDEIMSFIENQSLFYDFFLMENMIFH